MIYYRVKIVIICLIILNMSVIILQSVIIHILDNEILDVWRTAIKMINELNKKVDEIENERNKK